MGSNILTHLETASKIVMLVSAFILAYLYWFEVPGFLESLIDAQRNLSVATMLIVRGSYLPLSIGVIFVMAVAGQMIQGAILLRRIVCFSGALITAIVNVIVYLGWIPALVN